MNLRLKYFLIINLVIIAFAGSAQAADGKSYPGSMCTIYSGAGYDVTSRATIRNASATETLKVICPIVKDQNGIKDAKIIVIDPGSGAISCRVLTQFRENGEWKAWFPDPKSSQNGDPRTIAFNALNHDSRAGAHSYIRCTLPKKHSNGSAFHIVSYHVVEW